MILFFLDAIMQSRDLTLMGLIWLSVSSIGFLQVLEDMCPTGVWDWEVVWI